MSEPVVGPPRDDPPEPRPDLPAAASEGAPAPDGASRGRRRRGSRGGRKRRRSGSAGSAVGRPPDEQPGGAPEAYDDAGGGRGAEAPDVSRLPDDLPDRPIEGRPSPDAAARAEVRPKIGDTRPAPFPRPAVPGDEERPERADRAGGDGKVGTRRRRRGGRGRGGGARRPVGGDGEKSAGDDAAALELAEEEAPDRRRGRERNGRPVGRYLMCVQVRPNATQIAVLEGRALIEHYVSRPQDDVTQIDGNIYLGRVQNVLPGMEAAFVDIGTPKNAVLYRGDVRYDPDDLVTPGDGTREGAPANTAVPARIEQLLRPGQTLVCQVTKNPIGTKGARLTQEVSLPGRFVVLIPNSDTYGISKRLADEERRRLRRVLDHMKPDRHGIIVRTAAEGASAEELRRDIARLVEQWEGIDRLGKRSRAPALLYREPDMAVRVIREEFNRDYRGVVIDDLTLYEEVRSYVASISPELADRVELYDSTVETLPIFERFHVHEQLHKALDRKVWLQSGGSIIIERTEALTVIDVNTGKNVGRSSLEETVYRNNLEAAEEIARQLRLRDIGGIIVIDFIDMEVKANRDSVMRAFRDALGRDKTRTQVFDISELGLVEMTRKRVSEGLVESFSQTCPACGGRGIVFDESLL